MTVGDLREILAQLPEDMEVVIPVSPFEGFTGAFFSPCMEESQPIELGLEDLSEEDIEERKLLNKEVKTETSFVLVPCGFFTEPEYEESPPELN